jgi:hypothetical protein
MTKDDVEIDLVVDRPGKTRLLVEVKPSTRVGENDFRAAFKIAKELKNSLFLVASREKQSRKLEDYTIYPWQEALNLIFE